ncbi:MAG: hypothetical protein ACE5HF_02725 [Gemmatimonadota bacterium]
MTPEEREAGPEVMGLDPWGLRRIEKLLASLDGVDSMKIVPDGHGGIDEIHVLSSSSLGPKQIVRNIESALLAEFGLQIDHRKISIARVKAPEIEAAPVPEVTPSPAARAGERRILLDSVQIERRAGQTVSCRVELLGGSNSWVGEADGPDFEQSRLDVAATAALTALQQASDSDAILSLNGIARAELFGRNLVIAVIHGRSGREFASLAGIATVKDSPEEAAVLACLQATNRWADGR